MESTSSHPDDRPTAITIGNFDAVHLGHKALLSRCRAGVGERGKVLALAFDPHPASVRRPERMPSPIEEFQVRRRRLLEAGADGVIVLRPSPELLSMSPQIFLDHVIDSYAPTLIVEGHDFHFGKRRQGTPTVLRELAALRGVGVEIVPPVRVALTDQSIVTASSTVARWLITHGRVRDAGFVLGRPHELVGTVVRGDQLGRQIGFPTANLSTRSLLPHDGVYAATALLPDGGLVGGAVNVGARPTVGGSQRRAEAHLFGPDGAGWAPASDLSQYDWPITIGLVGWIRDQVRFASVDALVEQLSRDVARARRMVAPLLHEPSSALASRRGRAAC